MATDQRKEMVCVLGDEERLPGWASVRGLGLGRLQPQWRICANCCQRSQEVDDVASEAVSRATADAVA